ncbi:TonB-dependent receptor [Longimicrobium sp.]|uniref:TonB-dependent receptor family protein n=1 Tax=Longimicrobium sp. TaxID=2029185 RepID=UPI002C39D49F|nr:TonB-dependent receptor [Longimicrobium sp.]HSU15276.1 TonB-dependent receptor [Longimicrobium sp.]
MPRIFRYAATLALALAAFRASGAGAQQGAPADTAKRYSIDTLAVRVLRAPVPPLRAPFAVSITGGEAQRRAKPGLALNEPLAAIPGVQVENRFNYALGERIAVRGLGARAQFGVRGVRVLVDGLPATMPDGQTTLNHVDVGSIGGAEVIRGPASALYGNASGGVIRLNTLPPPPVPLGSEYRATAGAGGLLRLQSWAGGMTGPAAYRASFTRLKYGGYRQHQSADNTQVGLNFGLHRGADELRLVFTAVHYDAENPGALSDSLLRADRTAAIPTNVTQKAGEEGRQGQLGLTWIRALGTGSLEVTGYGLARSIDNPIPVRFIDLDRAAGGARAVWSGGLIGPLHASAGGEWELQHDHRLNHENVAGVRGSLLLDQTERVTSAAAFAELSADAGPITVLGAARYDRFRFSVDDHLVTAADPDDSGARTMDAWSPTLGVSLSAARWLSFYGNVATAFQTPTTTELANRPSGAGGFNPELRPERTTGIEAGAKARRGAVWGEVAAYRARIRDALIPFELEGFPGRQFYRNAGAAVHRGIEAGAGAEPVAGLTLRAAYTYTDARFGRYVLGGADLRGNRVPGIAPHRIEASAFWSRGAGPFAGVDLRHESRTPVADTDAAGSLASPACTTVDLRGGWTELRLGRVRASPTLGITNLFGVVYNTSVVINAARGRFYEPGPGRSVYAGMEIKLGSGW